MKKDILDKLAVKESENLSEKNLKQNTVLGINRDLHKLKINDDFSNEDVINSEYTRKITNSYIELKDTIKKDK